MLQEATKPSLGPCTCQDTLGNPVDLEEFVFVPRYNLQASAGYGAAVDGEKPVFSMAFRRYWIVNYLHADPHDLSVISVKGDSMEGVLNDKDVILINRSDTSATSGLFVLRIDGDLVVKRVQRLPGSILKVTSANEAYEPFTVDINNPPSDFSVVGRVVWFGRQVA
ncbi:S24 family peptidase [Microvirgula aerodenitrificans]|uniref:S24 family peptidase n=1 Tax=Microvirgula aerodenitrificans TaxID=57480 RepID=UPI0036F43BE0